MSSGANILQLREQQLRAALKIKHLEKARNDFFFFMTYLFPDKSKSWGWHHKTVCGLLQRFYEGEWDNLMLFMPPQHQKSTMMSEYFPAWVLGKNPDLQTLILMYNDTKAKKQNRKIQRVLDTDLYREIFPETQINSKNVVTDAKAGAVRNASEFEVIGRLGGVKSAGVGGGIAGEPCKLGLIDDIIKNVEQANSKTYRDKTYEWYTDELEARLHNDSKIAFTITRRHEEDLAGQLIKRDGTTEEGGKWKVIKFPALKEDDSNPDDPREIGEALFPQLHSKKRMEDRRDNAPRTFASLYQQRPAPLEGGIIKESYFNIVKPYQIPSEIDLLPMNFVVDTAHTAKTSADPSAILAYKSDGKDIYLYHRMKKRVAFSDLVSFLRAFVVALGNDQSITRVEPKANGKDVVDYLKKNTDINIVEYKMPSGDKEARISVCEPKMIGGRVYMVEGDWNESFIEECKVFPNGAHDEDVDLLSMAITQALIRSDYVNQDSGNYRY